MALRDPFSATRSAFTLREPGHRRQAASSCLRPVSGSRHKQTYCWGHKVPRCGRYPGRAGEPCGTWFLGRGVGDGPKRRCNGSHSLPPRFRRQSAQVFAGHRRRRPDGRCRRSKGSTARETRFPRCAARRHHRAVLDGKVPGLQALRRRCRIPAGVHPAKLTHREGWAGRGLRGHATSITGADRRR